MTFTANIDEKSIKILSIEGIGVEKTFIEMLMTEGNKQLAIELKTIHLQ